MTEMDQLKSSIIEAVEKVRTENPLAGSVTNGVTMDFVANAQLAVGGSAAMVYLPDEGECLVAAGGAAYLNMGAAPYGCSGFQKWQTLGFGSCWYRHWPAS